MLLKCGCHRLFARPYDSYFVIQNSRIPILPDSGRDSISGSWQEATCSHGAAARHTGRAHIYDTRTGWKGEGVFPCVCARARTHQSTPALSISGPSGGEFVLSWLGRQDESMPEQLTGHAYSSAKEKGEKRGASEGL